MNKFSGLPDVINPETGEVEPRDQYVCYENANFSFIVNIGSMFLNFGLYSYLQNLEYGTDLLWSKFAIILAGNIGIQLTGATFAATLMIQEQIAKI